MIHNSTYFQLNFCTRLVCTTKFVMEKYDRRRRLGSGLDRQHCRFPSSSLPVAVPSGSTGRRQSPLRAHAIASAPLVAHGCCAVGKRRAMWRSAVCERIPGMDICNCFHFLATGRCPRLLCRLEAPGGDVGEPRRNVVPLFSIPLVVAFIRSREVHLSSLFAWPTKIHPPLLSREFRYTLSRQPESTLHWSWTP